MPPRQRDRRGHPTRPGVPMISVSQVGPHTQVQIIDDQHVSADAPTMAEPINRLPGYHGAHSLKP
jgi:hypothetical protein